jgi:hypothetical protein
VADRAGDEVLAFLANLPRPRVLSQAEASAEKAREAASAREERRRHLLARHIPAKDVERLLAVELVRTVAIRKTHAWLRDPARRLLVLSGEKDSGKTTAAAYAAAADPTEADRRWLREGAPLGRYIEAELLIGAWYHRGVERDARGIEHVVEPLTGMNRAELVTCSLLVIDDAGQEPAKLAGETGEAIDIIVRLRCDRMLRTVLTTNETTVEAFAQRYEDGAGRGARLLERLTEHGLWIDCPVEGLRRSGAIEKRLEQQARERASVGRNRT